MKSFDKTKYFLGKLCLYWHNYEGTGKSLRYLWQTSACVICALATNKKNYAKRSDKIRTYNQMDRSKKRVNARLREDRKKNPEKYAKAKREYRKNNRERVTLLDRIRYANNPGIKKKSMERRRSPAIRARARITTLKLRAWQSEIEFARGKPELEKEKLLKLVESAVAAHATFLGLKATLREL